MRIIISPAKKMRVEDTIAPEGRPELLDDASRILSYLRGLDEKELRRLWKANDRIASQAMESLMCMDLGSMLSPALFSYDGIQYEYMSPSSFEDGMIRYCQENLRIISALFGVLRPLDGIAPYRLEFQAKAHVDGTKDLYAFWGDRICRKVLDDTSTVVNLASDEYSKAVRPHLPDGAVMVTPVFADKTDKGLVTKGVYAKMARGEMVRFLAQNRIERPEDMKAFDIGYSFDSSESTDTEYVFVRRTAER